MRQRLHTAATPARLLTTGVSLALLSVLLTAFVHPATTEGPFAAARGFFLGMGLTLIIFAGIRQIQVRRR